MDPTHVLFISTRSIRNKFASKYQKVVHEDCAWLSLPAAKLNAKQVRSLLLRHENSVRHLILLVPLSNRLLFQLPCVWEDTVVAVVAYSRPSDVDAWFQGVKNLTQTENRVIITSMQKPFYLKWARKFCGDIKQHHKDRRVLFKPPELATKKDIGKSFAAGFRFCIYTGHGRSRGWSGYRGLRWSDIDAEKEYNPSGGVLSLSCSAFDIKSRRQPFAMQWVTSGRLNTFCGFASQVQIQPLVILSNYILDFLANHSQGTIAGLARYLNQRVLENGNEMVMREWRSFKIAGNPLVQVL